MIIQVPTGRVSRETADALRRAAKAIERQLSEKQAITVADRAVEKKRMRHKVRATNALRKAIVGVLNDWQVSFWKGAPITQSGSLREALIREDDSGNEDTLSQQQHDELVAQIYAMQSSPLRAVLFDAAEEAYDEGVKQAVAEIRINSGQDIPIVDNPQAVAAIKKRLFAFADDVTASQQAAIKAILIDSYDKDTPVKDLAVEIAQFFKDGVHRTGEDGVTRTYDAKSWADMVARTETNYASNVGILQQYRDNGIRRVKWLAAADACPICQTLDGEVVDIDTVFPGSDFTHPPAHTRCRCSVIAAGDDQGHTDHLAGSGSGDDGDA